MKAEELVKRLADALGTEETGEDLIEVARNAHRAEQELAARKRRNGALSPRETEAVKLLSRGHTNKEIGRALTIHEGTVKRYVGSVMQKLGLKNRVQVANWWREQEHVGREV